jgi:ABC-type multidrug transport system fused ATPase/permease subunit
MDIWLKERIIGFIRNLIKKEQEEKNYIESQDLFGEELYNIQNKENPKKKKSFVLKLFDNNKIINKRNSFKYSSSTELIKDIKLCKKSNYNYIRHNSDSKLPIISNTPPKEILIQTIEKEKNNILFKIIGYFLTLLKHYLEIYIPTHKANVINSITKHKTYDEFITAFKYYIFYLIVFTLLTNMSSWIQSLLIYLFSIKDTQKNKNIMLENVLKKDMEFFDKNKIEDIHKDLKTFQKGPITINLVELFTQLLLYGTKFLYILYYLYINFYELFSLFMIMNIIKATNNKITSYQKSSKICETLEKQREKLADGSINIRKHRNKPRYYLHLNKRDKYLGQNDTDLIRELIQKDLIDKAIKAATHEAEVLKNDIIRYPKDVHFFIFEYFNIFYFFAFIKEFSTYYYFFFIYKRNYKIGIFSNIFFGFRKKYVIFFICKYLRR